MTNTDIIKNIYYIVASATNTEDSEYSEISDSIRLVIHETIDKVNEKATEMVNATVKDIIDRLDLESDGHNLDKDKLNKMIVDLSNEIYNIYADTDDKEISSGDLFKYAVTKMLNNELDNKLNSGSAETEGLN